MLGVMGQESTHIPAQEKYTLREQGMSAVSQSSALFGIVCAQVFF
jgi:hypothetical protein